MSWFVEEDEGAVGLCCHCRLQPLLPQPCQWSPCEGSPRALPPLLRFMISQHFVLPSFRKSRPVDDTLQRGLHLVQEHESTLRVIERDVGDATESVPDEYYEPVTVSLCPQERVLALDLINTGKEENFFKKVLAVFAYLCDEIHELHDIAAKDFFPELVMFGAPESGAEEEALPPPGLAEEQMGRMLPFLQKLSNFVERCHNCAVNLIQQLAKLYNGGSSD